MNMNMYWHQFDETMSWLKVDGFTDEITIRSPSEHITNIDRNDKWGEGMTQCI